MLLGRRSECAAIDRLLDVARLGQSGTLVVRGAPGIGKSALLGYAMGAWTDFRVTELWVETPGDAVAFYEAAFGATVHHRIGEGTLPRNRWRDQPNAASVRPV